MSVSNQKIVLITGGSRGLGRNMAIRSAEKGLDVIFTYHSNEAAAAETRQLIEAQGQRAMALQLDTTQVDSFNRFHAELKSVLAEHWQRESFDFLVNNAGTTGHGTVDNTSEKLFDQLFSIHFKGVYFLTQELLSSLEDGGGIVNVSTGLARFAIPGYSAYASMKGAIETYTTYLAKELGSRGIRANTVAPGAIDTDFNAAAFDNNPGMKDFLAGVTSLGRVGQAGDIGGVVAFLLTEDARWVTAQRIEASGGMFI